MPHHFGHAIRNQRIDLSPTSYIRTLFFNCLWLTIFAISLPWLAWRMVTKGKNRRGWKQKLLGLVPKAAHTASGKRIWLHAVSVGEVHVLKTLVNQLQREHEDFQLFISTTTETGVDRATALFADQHQVFFFPFDFSWAINNVFDRVQPDMLVLAELELWPNLIQLAHQRSLPVMVANGRLSENSHTNYQRVGWLTRPMFQKLSVVAVQDKIYAKRFIDLGCDSNKVIVTGNLKYDAVETNRKNDMAESCREIARQAGLVDSAPTIVAGSTQIEDETVAIDAWLKLRGQFRGLNLIVVPRHPDRVAETVALLDEYGIEPALRSETSCLPEEDPQTAPESVKRRSGNRERTEVLIVDVIGELSGWWALADVAFVGGSMGTRGGQNMIEPAAYGVPVCFGPNTANFKSSVDGLLASEAAKVVASSDELVDFAFEMLGSGAKTEAIGKRAQEYVLGHSGAVGKTVELIQGVLDTDSPVFSNRAA